MSDIRESISDLQTNVNEIKDHLNEKLIKLEKDVRINSSNISFIAQQLDRSKLRKELYISGVPVTPNECISEIFGKICLVNVHIRKIFLEHGFNALR